MRALQAIGRAFEYEGAEMSDISELENRISAALDRIAWSVENTPAAADVAPAPQAAPDADLVEELEIERATNAKLLAAKEQQTGQLQRLEVRVARLTERLEAADIENRRLENVIDSLGSNNDALRLANMNLEPAGAAATEGLDAQLAHLKAARAKDLAELTEIMAEVGPALKEA